MKHILSAILLILLFSSTSCTKHNSTSISENGIVYNNETDYSKLITTKHLNADFFDLETLMQNEDIYFEDFQKEFQTECIRKTFQGYYAVLELEYNDLVGFAFFDDNKKLNNIFATSGFRESSEFDFVEKNVTTAVEINEYDKNCFPLPVSSKSMCAHITTDGLLVFSGKHSIGSSIIENVKFFSNNELINNPDLLTNYNTPYILPVDRTDNK
jgi:hypothetical protein